MYDTSELRPHIRDIVESDSLFNSAPSQLLTVSNAKTRKGESLGWLTAILYLSPADLLSLRLNLCASAKIAGCIDGCLNTAGRGAFNSVQRARIRKTLYWWQYHNPFMALLVRDIERVQRMADRQGLKLAVRLNGTSDIRWEKQFIQLAPFNTNASDRRTIFDMFPNVQFYDYTKIPGRTVPSNYDLTFSGSARVEFQPILEKQLQHNPRSRIAIVCKNMDDLIDRNNGVHVDGDTHDLRFLDADNALVVLSAKGKMKHDTSGFCYSEANL
jgi:hypothetical protein